MKCPYCGARNGVRYDPEWSRWYCDYCETYLDDDQLEDMPYKPPSDVEVYERKMMEWNERVRKFNDEAQS